MHLADIVDSRAVVAGVKAQSKKQLLLEVAEILGQQADVSARAVFEVLTTREKLGSTGLGEGIAIPHGRLNGLKRVHGVFLRLATPIAFDSVDGQPVDLVFGLLAPAHAGADHLTALARISRLLREPRTVAKLRGTETAEGLYAIITDPPAAATAA
jgi:nitrogen PTS system EIIA component